MIPVSIFALSIGNDGAESKATSWFSSTVVNEGSSMVEEYSKNIKIGWGRFTRFSVTSRVPIKALMSHYY
jgi:hypothetical protein